MNDAVGSRPPEQEALTEEIQRTREELGETVEALAAKVDVKARAQRRAAEVKGNLLGKARDAKDKVTAQAGERRGEAVVIVRGHYLEATAAAAAVAAVIFAWLALRSRR
jgi:hypothetical protein